ncbi:unnamed protein product, partial [Adineta ricciae]
MVNLLSLVDSEELVNIDHTICGGPPSVIICVQRTLNEIATAANNIHSLTIRIEQNIVNTLSFSSSPSHTHTNDHASPSLVASTRSKYTHSTKSHHQQTIQHQQLTTIIQNSSTVYDHEQHRQ